MKFGPGKWIGVVLDEPIGETPRAARAGVLFLNHGATHRTAGGGNGSKFGLQYFACPPGQGVFVKAGVLAPSPNSSTQSSLPTSPYGTFGSVDGRQVAGRLATSDSSSDMTDVSHSIPPSPPQGSGKQVPQFLVKASEEKTASPVAPEASKAARAPPQPQAPPSRIPGPPAKRGLMPPTTDKTPTRAVAESRAAAEPAPDRRREMDVEPSPPPRLSAPPTSPRWEEIEEEPEEVPREEDDHEEEVEDDDDGGDDPEMELLYAAEDGELAKVKQLLAAHPESIQLRDDVRRKRGASMRVAQRVERDAVSGG